MFVHGVVYNEVRGMACSEKAITFCHLFSLHQTATFSFPLYGDELALALAYMWCHNMQWRLNVYVESGEDRLCFTQARLREYEEPAVAQRNWTSGSHASHSRARQIQSLMP